MSDIKPLGGKAALVTGSSHGMSKASARLLAQDGAVVMIMGRRQALLEQARDELRTLVPDARIEMFCGDAGRQDDARSAIEQASAMQQRLDIIVSAVGKGTYKPVLLLDEALRSFPDPNHSLDQIYGTEVMTAVRAGREPEPLTGMPGDRPGSSGCWPTWPRARSTSCCSTRLTG